MSTLRQALRSVRSAPGLGIAAVLCIGLGTAATTTVATLVSATLLRPVPFPDADRLVRLWFEEPGGRSRISLSIPEVADFERLESFDAFVATARVRTAARLSGGVERVRGEAVSRGYFELLGLRAAAGRLLIASDHNLASPPVVVLSHGTWLRHFGGSPAIVGSELRTDQAVYTIAGVAPRGFAGTVEDDEVEFFIPIEHYEPRSLTTSRTSRPTWAIGRLASGASMAAAQEQAEAVRARLAATYPDIYATWRVSVEPFGESWRQRLRSGGAVLFGAAALLLLIAAVNVGSLLLARVLDRRRELAIRSALGAERGQIAAQLFAETLMLVAAGGALGVLAGPWVLDAFMAISPLGRLTLPRYLQIEADGRTFAIVAGTLGVAGLIAGTVPALLGRRVMPGDVLREGGRGSIGRRTERRWGAVLIAGETALTLALLMGGGLLVRSYSGLSSLDPGFARDRIARLAVTFSHDDFVTRDRLPLLYDRLRRELAAVPGVARVGLVSPTLPPWVGANGPVRLEGVDLPQAPDGLDAGTHLVDEGLLPMLGVAIVAGRNVDAADGPGGPPVAVISRSLARHFGGPQAALGRTLTFPAATSGRPGGGHRVVGVAEDIAFDGLVEQDSRTFVRAGAGADVRASRYDVYVPLAAYPDATVSIGAYTEGDPAALLEPLQRAVSRAAPASPTHWVSTMADEMALEYEPTRFYTVLVLAFSSSALALTSVGLFALLSHAASRRIGEMGLRLALGASPASVAALVVREGLAPLGFGVAVGGTAAALAWKTMSSLLYGIEGFDAAAFAGAVAALILVTLGASVVPARRVAKVDPLRALRTD